MTPSELQVARMAAEGLSNAAIARARGTSLRTVANQIAKVLRELGATSRRTLAVRAELGLEVRPPVSFDWAGLTGREQAVLAGIARGLSQKVIAIDLGVAPSTVSKVVRSARARAGLPSFVDLVRAIYCESSAPSLVQGTGNASSVR